MRAYAKPHEDGLMKVYERFMKEDGEPKTMADVGTYLHMIKEAEPRFTGRAIKNVTDAIKMRAMDIELPDDWFEKPETFMHKSYDDKKAMIEELRGPFSTWTWSCRRSTATPTPSSATPTAPTMRRCRRCCATRACANAPRARWRS